MLVNISRGTFRSFCNSLRGATGNSISNTEMMDMVSAALGWRRDALTHQLKTKTVSIEVEDGFLRALIARINGLSNIKIRPSDVQPMLDAMAEDTLTSAGTVKSDSEEEWQIFRRVALLLEAKQADAANEFSRQLDETSPPIRLMKGLIGLALGHVAAEVTCASAVRNNPALIHPLANLSGIDIEKPIAPFENEQPWDQLAPIKRVGNQLSDAELMVRPLGGGYGHKNDDIRLYRVIGGLRRPDLKGRAYRAVIDAGVSLPADFIPYLEAMPPSKNRDTTVCLIDGTERMMIKPYLRSKFAIHEKSYLAFFDTGRDAMVHPDFVASKVRYASKTQKDI